MRLLSSVAAAAVLTFAVPALAQEAAPAPQAPAAAPAQPESPEQAALQAKGEAFEAKMNQMGAELNAVMEDDAKDAATKTSETDAIIARYEPEMTSFASEMETFMKAEAEKPENAEQKAQMVEASTAVSQQIRGIPDQIRAGIQQAIAAEAAAPSAPVEAPPEPQ